MYAHYERIVAAACARSHDMGNAVHHYLRAQRICSALTNVPAQLDLSFSWRESTGQHVDEPQPNVIVPTVSSSNTIQCVATILANASHPEIVGRELCAMLKAEGLAQSMTVLLRSEDGTEESLEHVELIRAQASESRSKEHRFALGISRSRAVEFLIRSDGQIESTATIRAVSLIAAAIKELQRARAERDERSTLWPSEELPLDGDRVVILGHMREQMTLARRVARTNVTVMITGESGTGKEIIARAIHDCSDRADKPFIPVNCAAVPRELMESQLFGHRRGAFTGADRDYPGFIRAASGGTLFLDEVAELSLDLQPKLLRFLESGEIAPLGEPEPLTVHVRVLAATNKNLAELVREGKFREDLFYRLNVVPLSIRPLRERRDEIPALVQHFVDRAAAQFKKGHLTVAEETLERLLLYRWPGNVRQLQHELQRIVALAEPNSVLLPDAISEEILGALPLLRPVPRGREIAIPLTEKLPSTIARIECEMIKVALKEHRGKVEAAARALGISRKGLYLKRQRLGL
jgi:transcriptional regulator with PAS, ATPase and Fis domain